MKLGERVMVIPLGVRAAMVNELEFSLLLCFTGIPRQSAHIIADQTHRVKAAESPTLDGLRAQKQLAVAMKSALLRGRLNEFGELLGEAWREHEKAATTTAT